MWCKERERERERDKKIESLVVGQGAREKVFGRIFQS